MLFFMTYAPTTYVRLSVRLLDILGNVSTHIFLLFWTRVMYMITVKNAIFPPAHCLDQICTEGPRLTRILGLGKNRVT